MMTLDAELDILCRGAARVVAREELAQRLAAARDAGRPLLVKLGLDPTAPDIHLGHTVVLRKARDFQDLGHRVIIVIGDFTGRIGDPSGRSEARRQLSAEQVADNARTYVSQLHRVLDPDRTDIRFNSHWLQPLDFAAVIALAAKTTVARMLERDDFAGRFRDGRPIFLHEFFYALMQGYDSVAIEADVELGGTDQTFNLMLAREIQRDYGQPPEIAVIMPLLVGLDGVQKMGKSLGNYVGIDEGPAEMFGKLMSLPDALIEDYLMLCTRLPAADVAARMAAIAAGGNPRDAKLDLAEAIVAAYHGTQAGSQARDGFVRVFSHKEQPADIPEWRVPAGWQGTAVDLVAAAGLAPSKGEARRLVRAGAVDLAGERLTDPQMHLAITDGQVLRVGKRAFLCLRVGPGA